MKRYWILFSVVLILAAAVIYNHVAMHQAPPNVVLVPEIPATAPQPAPNSPAPTRTFETSMLKPPAGSRVAIYEFEDLECPACAHAFPIVRAAVDHYHIPLIRHDYPLTFHIWSFDAAVTARYIQDRLSPALAEDFRGAVFANQVRIASKDDLATFTRSWFQAHNRSLPFVMDPSGSCKLEVESDRALGDRVGVGVRGTPCLFVVTQNSVVHLDNVGQLDRAIVQALAQTAGSAAVFSKPEGWLPSAHS